MTMKKRSLKVKDIERLENTSAVAVLGAADAIICAGCTVLACTDCTACSQQSCCCTASCAAASCVTQGALEIGN